MSKPVDGFYEAARYLGQFLKQIEPLLSETACLGSEEREMIAMLRFIQKRAPESKKEIEELIEYYRAIGFAHWRRDIVTDMAIKIGVREDVDSYGEEDSDSSEDALDT